MAALKNKQYCGNRVSLFAVDSAAKSRMVDNSLKVTLHWKKIPVKGMID